MKSEREAGYGGIWRERRGNPEGQRVVGWGARPGALERLKICNTQYYDMTSIGPIPIENVQYSHYQHTVFRVSNSQDRLNTITST